EDVRGLPYEHDVLPSGLRLTRQLRALYRAGVERGECPPSIFTPEGEERFLAWLNASAPDAPRVSRFLHALWLDRPDLQRAYPRLPAGDAGGFLRWCMEHGSNEVPIADVLLPAPVTRRRARAERSSAGSVVRPFGVNVAGYLRSELGIGEVARQLIRGLDTAGVPVLPVGLRAEASRQGHAYAAGGIEHNPFGVNLVCVNADGTPGFASQAGPRFFEDRYTIGVWWWETSDFPERFMEAFEHVDEVWVGSRFVAETLEKTSPPVPITHVPIPVEFPAPPPLRAGEHGWPDAFTFLYSWDYCSVFARKNPLAAVEAYRAAFTPDDGTALVLKCINPGFDPAGHRRLVAAIEGRPDVVLIDDYVDPREKDRMMRSCDCYVSLHRSEGLGLTVAEALFHGRPVIATGYSGTADFMTEDNSWRVPYDLVPIGPGADPYPSDGTWAEPDVAEAARLMRHVFDHPDEAAARARQGARDMRTRFSAEASGAVMRARLERIVAQRDAPDAFEAAEAGRRELRSLLWRGPRPTQRSRFGKAGGAVRRVVLRTIRPYAMYQRRVDEAIEQTLVAGMAGAQASVLAQLRAQSARLDALDAEVDAERARAEERAAAGERVAARCEELTERASELAAESRTLPYMSTDAFRTFDAGAAGTVLGYDEARAVAPEDAYRAFEDLFRGGEAFIAERQRRYLDVIGPDCAPALDVGCGRGELLDVLAEAGIAASGVDADAGMVARCREKGHAVALGDGVAHLEGLEDGSLGLVFSAQVVEHLPPDVLKRLLAAAARKLRPGGLLIAETVNPHSPAALKAFWVDVTHRHPLFPETMLALCRIAGFGSAYVFHPNGAGDVERDRYACGEYAVVARR
ncbi:MAG TPA: methyltransferase domain-containing protein, partial [Conexibacter sp.]|nr:methyltransferase domain-containing protein [Conexibacter sp.]